MSWTGGFSGVNVRKEDPSVTSEFIGVGEGLCGGLTSVEVVAVWRRSGLEGVSVSHGTTGRDGGGGVATPLINTSPFPALP